MTHLSVPKTPKILKSDPLLDKKWTVSDIFTKIEKNVQGVTFSWKSEKAREKSVQGGGGVKSSILQNSRKIYIFEKWFNAKL